MFLFFNYYFLIFAGTSKYSQREAELLFHVPMVGFVESLNISVAVGMALQSCRHAGMMQPDLDEEEKALLKAKWLLTDVIHSKKILARHNIELLEH